MEDVFVMTNDVEMRGVSLSTRKYHDIPIKKNIPKKTNLKGVPYVFQNFSRAIR